MGVCDTFNQLVDSSDRIGSNVVAGVIEDHVENEIKEII